MKKAHLSDLFVRGKQHTITDEEAGLEAVVYLKKLNLTESEKAVRAANASRAAILAQSKDPESELYKATLNETLETDRDGLLKFVITDDLNKRRESVSAEIADKDEWKDDDYLQGLHDAWLNGMAEAYAEDPDNIDAKAVFEGLKKYADEIDAGLVGEEEALIRDKAHLSDDELRDLAVKRLLKQQSDSVWVDAFRNQELLAAVRDPDDIRVRYFSDVAEVSDLEGKVKISLLNAYRELSVDVQEGKDLQETPSS